jgi:serine/threonine-protein kinase
VGAVQPFFSPDGRWVAFFTEDGNLKKVPLSGGKPVTVASGINGSQWAFGTWTESDTIVVGTSTGGLLQVSADGGRLAPLTTLDSSKGERSHVAPAVMRGTRAVLFTVSYATEREARIEAVFLDTGKRQVVVENAYDPHDLVSGHLVFQRDDVVLVAPFDRERLSLTGPPVPLSDEIHRDGVFSTGSVAQLAVSANGTLAFGPAADASNMLVLVSRDGKAEPIAIPPGSYDFPQVSPDGRQVAFGASKGREEEVDIYEFARGTTTRLSPGNGPAWHPNGNAVVMLAGNDGRTLSLKALDGGERVLATPPPGFIFRNTSWSPDGRLLAYTAQNGGQHDIRIMTVGETIQSTPFLDSPAAEHSPRFSRDGKWLLYASNESGRYEIYIKGYPRGERLAVSADGGVGPLWSRDGKEIFFEGQHDDTQTMMAVSVTSSNGALRLGKPTPLFSMRASGPVGAFAYRTSINAGNRYDVLPDGRFLMIRGADPTANREIVVVLNWFDEVRRLIRQH